MAFCQKTNQIKLEYQFVFSDMASSIGSYTILKSMIQFTTLKLPQLDEYTNYKAYWLEIAYKVIEIKFKASNLH